MGTVYETGLSEFLLFLSSLMDDAFYPYRSAYRGHWQAKGIAARAERAYQEAFLDPTKSGLLAQTLSAYINEEVLDYLSQHFSGFIYGPDLTVFGNEIGIKLQEIVNKHSMVAKEQTKIALKT